MSPYCIFRIAQHATIYLTKYIFYICLFKFIKNVVSHIFPLEGNLDIDAGDGVAGGPFRTQIPPDISKVPKNVRKL